MSEANDRPGDEKAPKGFLGRLRGWVFGELKKMDDAEREIERFRKELEEKNRRGARRTDGRI